MLKVSEKKMRELLARHGVGRSGRTNGTKNVPPILREVVGKLAAVDGSSEVARVFDVSEARASDYKNGFVTKNGKEDSHGLGPKIASFVERAQEQAAEKLLHAIGVITPAEVEAAPLKTKLDVVDRFAGVVNKLRTPSEAGPSIRDSNVLIYRPEPKKEEDYERIKI